VGKSEQRELASRMAVLLAHLLKWQYQPSHRTSSWKRTIKERRKAIGLRLKKTPSLNGSLTDPDWLAESWSDAVSKAVDETGLDVFPENCAWSPEEILSQDFYPEN